MYFLYLQIDQRFRSIDNQPFEIDMSFVGIYVAKVIAILAFANHTKCSEISHFPTTGLPLKLAL